MSRNPTEIATISLTEPENTLRAMSSSPFPRCMDIRTDEPAATMSETAMNTVMMGHARLTAARASLPRKFPTNMPSAMVHIAHTSPEIIPGMEHFRNRRQTGILP